MSLRLEAKIGADGRGFFGTMDQVDKRVKGFASGVSNLKNTIGTVFAAYGVSSFVRSVVQMADSITHLSERLGINAEWLQKFQYALTLSGGDLDSASRAIEKLNQSRAEILSGSQAGEGLLKSAQTLGLTKAGFKNLRSEDIIELIAKAVKNGDPQALYPAVSDLLGRTGRYMMAAFASDLEATMAQAPAMSDSARKALHDAAVAWESFVMKLKTGAAGPFATSLDFITKALTGWQVILVRTSFILKTWIEGWQKIMWALLRGNPQKAFEIWEGYFSKPALKNILAEASRRGKEVIPKPEPLTSGIKPAPFKEATPESPTSWDYIKNIRSAMSGLSTGTGGRIGGGGDELLRVGNFLGTNTQGLMNSIAQKQLDVARQQLLVQNMIALGINEANKALRFMGGREFPIPPL